MKKLIFLFSLFLLLCNLAYSQEVEEDYDKFKKIRSIELKDNIELQTGLDESTLRFDIDISKTTNETDTLYSFWILSTSFSKSYCGKGVETVLLLDNSKTITLTSYAGEFDFINTYWAYVFESQLTLQNLIDIYNAKTIDVKSYLKSLDLQAKFSPENKKDLNNYLKKYLLKGLVN